MSYRLHNPASTTTHDDDPPPYEAEPPAIPPSYFSAVTPSSLYSKLIHVPHENWLRQSTMRNNGNPNTHEPPKAVKAIAIPMSHPQDSRPEMLETDGHTTIFHNFDEFLVPTIFEGLEVYVMVLICYDLHIPLNERYLLWYNPTWDVVWMVACDGSNGTGGRKLIRYKDLLDHGAADSVEADPWFTGRMEMAAELIDRALVKDNIEQY